MKKIIIYWRDIPAQVLVQRGRVREKTPLSPRFHKAIDRSAMRAGKGSSDAYIAEWRRVSSNCDTNSQMVDVLDAEIRRIEKDYSDERLAALIRSHGVDDSLPVDRPQTGDD